MPEWFTPEIRTNKITIQCVDLGVLKLGWGEPMTQSCGSPVSSRVRRER